MDHLKMEYLVNCFNEAKLLSFFGGHIYVAIVVEFEGIVEQEIIINHSENIDYKLDYYKKTYDENLNHKFAKGIKIVGFAYGDNFDEIEKAIFG